VGNNEDGWFTFRAYVNVFPKTQETKYGYFTLSLHSAKNGENANIQGGMNEAGLTFDFNALDQFVEVKDLHRKKSFPGGDGAILSHLLADCETVQEVISFFEEYWFEIGFNHAQMHLADRYGNFAIIGPSGWRLLTDTPFQVSTNFDICAGADGSSCWRFPIATEKLESNGANLASFVDICKSTAINGMTIYSNIQNLNTGEIWFFFAQEYDQSYKTNIKDLLRGGRKSYLIRDLLSNSPTTKTYNAFVAEGGRAAYLKYQSFNIPIEHQEVFLSHFVNACIGAEYNLDAYPCLESYLGFHREEEWLHVARAMALHSDGHAEEAGQSLADFKSGTPKSNLNVQQLLDQLRGIFSDNANANFELHGYADAKSVIVRGLPGGISKFLARKDGTWSGKFKLSPGVYNYSFVVDGKSVLDSRTPVKVIQPLVGEAFTSHQICIGLSDEMYETTIRVRVPRKDDVVYIAGNQPNLTNWDFIIRLKWISDFERSIVLTLHYPAEFKFTRGTTTSEAIVKGMDKFSTMTRNSPTDNDTYEITQWKDRER